MDIQIEPNRRFGYGFQIRATIGPVSEVYDDEPLTMLEALQTLDEVMGMASRNYVCERCGGLARIVHHQRYITPQNIHDPGITLDWANLEALCIDCHNAEHMGGGVCAPGLTFDAAGNLVPVEQKFL